MDQTILQTAITQVSNNKIAADDLAVLAAFAESRQLKKGEILLKEGELCRAFYLVEKGYLCTFYIKDGIQINLNFSFEGNFTADVQSIKNKQPSEFTIAAGEDTSVWVFDLNNGTDRLNPPAAISIFIRRLAIRILLDSEEHSKLFKMYTPTERYRYIEKNNPQLLQRISLSQLASYLGMARETLSRIRAKNV